jgi:hypothetical protein
MRAEFWRLSVQGRPELSDEERAILVDGLLEPALEGATANEVCLTLVGRLFQVLLIIHLAQALAE